MCCLPLLILLILLPIHISNTSQSCQVKKGPGVSGIFHYAFPKSLMETLPLRITFHNSQSTLTFIIVLNIPHNYLRLIYLMVIFKLSLRHRKVCYSRKNMNSEVRNPWSWVQGHENHLTSLNYGLL